jgi:predicted restriction endonuclease
MENKETAIKGVIENQNFRNRLIEYWGGSSVSNSGNSDELIAVPIKSLDDCDEFEKNYFYNGLILCANYSRLFLEYLISFDALGQILISDSLSDSDIQNLGISRVDCLKKEKLSLNHVVYLAEHKQRFHGDIF